MEFEQHKFLMQPFSDFSPDQVIKKSAQVGWSTLAIFRSFHLCKYYGLNIAHVLPTQNVVSDFVFPKVDPIIAKNPVIQEMVSNDSKTLKGIGDRFIYYRGSFTERQAITISTDLNIIDEYDRSDQGILTTYDSRLQASKFGWRWRFSNPSAIGFGVDSLFQDSDQLHWFIKCPRCNHDWYIDWQPSSEKNHYVDKVNQVYACGNCEKELKSRLDGRWVAKFPKRPRRGYWVSQMMAPWVSAKRILEQHHESTPEFFHNFVLGKAYTPSDLLVNRETILRACSPSLITKQDVALGVDNGVVKTWVLGTPDGIFAYGQTESWDEIERLKLMYDAVMVMDPAPYPTTPKKLVDKYKGTAYICYFKQNQTNLKIAEWGVGVKSGVVYADRTKIIDLVAQEITDTSMLFRQPPHELEDYIEQWQNIYRATVEEEDGRVVSKWLKKEGRPNDYALATVYFRLALSKRLGGGSSVGKLVDDTIRTNESAYDLGDRIKEAYNPPSDWRNA